VTFPVSSISILSYCRLDQDNAKPPKSY